MKIGDKVPDIALYDTNKKAISLREFEGRNILVLFFPFAFSSVCTAELCDMRDQFAYYDELNVEIIGVSVDSLYTLAAYKNHQNLNFTLLSDFNKELSTAFNVLYEEFPSYGLKGVSKRAAFLVDKQGFIQHVDICNQPKDLPDFEAIQATLKSFN